MLSQMDPALVAYCNKIAAEGGPMLMPDDLGPTFPSTPVVQLGTVTRASARLRNVQPDVNLDQSYEALKRPKKIVDAAHTGIQAFYYLTRKLLRYIIMVLLSVFAIKQTNTFTYSMTKSEKYNLWVTNMFVRDNLCTC